MSWVSGQRYRFRVVQGQAQIENNDKTGTKSVQTMLECTAGPQLAQRVRWRGYLNTRPNQETAIGELRVMGWRGAKLGEWQGLGACEFEATVLSETGNAPNGEPRTYWRAAWPRAVATLKADKALKADDLAALNASMGDLLGRTDAAPLPPAPTPVDAGDGETGEIPF